MMSLFTTLLRYYSPPTTSLQEILFPFKHHHKGHKHLVFETFPILHSFLFSRSRRGIAEAVYYFHIE